MVVSRPPDPYQASTVVGWLSLRRARFGAKVSDYCVYAIARRVSHCTSAAPRTEQARLHLITNNSQVQKPDNDERPLGNHLAGKMFPEISCYLY